jgi:hypothetical protein
MLIGLLMLLGPIVIFLMTLPCSGRFEPSLRKAYRVGGGLIVFLGSAISYYFAAYTGDQGGIAAYFFQTAVIAGYLLFSVALTTLNWILKRKATGG